MNATSADQRSNTIKLSIVIENWITTTSSPLIWETIIHAVEGPIVNDKNKAKEILEHLDLINSKCYNYSIYIYENNLSTGFYILYIL